MSIVGPSSASRSAESGDANGASSGTDSFVVGSSPIDGGPRRPLPRSSLMSADFEELDLEHERRVRRDEAAARAARAVAEVRRDRELALAADLHAGDALVPTGDDLARADGERERLAAIERRVEL